MNHYDGDDREDVIREQSEADASGSADDRRPEKQPEGEREPDDTPGRTDRG